MATKDPAEAFGEVLADLLKLIFSLTFPLAIITLCGASFLLTFALHMPELSLWATLATFAIEYAEANIWAAVALAIFALATIPLTWVAFREQELRVSSTILAYVMAAIILGVMFWLRTVWPYNDSAWQIIAYGIIMFVGWSALIEAMLGTLGIVAHIRRNRPVPVKPPRQEPHGPREQGRPADEPETI